MPISGFTVVRNAEKMGYPLLPSLRSLLPVVDELVVAIGQCEDNTKKWVEELATENPGKIRIIDTIWDTQKTKGGLILSEKTNEALEYCKHDWCFYLQADEVLHEDDYPAIREAVHKAESDPSVEGLLFDYVHFYSSFSVIATSRRWYRREIRLVRKSSGAQSYKDAQGFRITDATKENRKLNVKHTGARVFHYGWVKPPQEMGRKARLMDYWWHGSKDNKDDQFEYDRQYGLRSFEDTHPEVMKELVAAQNWSFDHRRRWTDWQMKDFRLWTSDVCEKIFNYRLGEYKPYNLLKD